MRIELDSSLTPFSLNHTLSCGQTFRWQLRGDWWVGVVGKRVLKLRQINGDVIEFEASSPEVDVNFVRRYLRLDDDLLAIYSMIDRDRYVHAAVKRFYGLRLVRQEPWECLVSYICATFKNIPAIKQIILGLSQRFGSPVTFEGERFYGFPEPNALAEAKLHELRLCKLGYRAEYVRETAGIVTRGKLNLESLRELPYASAKSALMSLPGVGSKVADCVLLFSLDRLEAFPVDVWMKRIMLKYYSGHFESGFVEKLKKRTSISKSDYEIIHAFGRRYFGEHVGYAQEYLYHFERCKALSKVKGWIGVRL